MSLKEKEKRCVPDIELGYSISAVVNVGVAPPWAARCMEVRILVTRAATEGRPYI